MQTAKKVLALILAALLAFGAFAITASADSTVTLDIANGKIVITDTGYSIAGGAETAFTGAYKIMGTTTDYTHSIVVNGSATITLSDLNVDFSADGYVGHVPIELSGAGSCTLILEGINTLKASGNAPAVKLPNANKITITGSGRLNAYGGAAWPAIGKQYGGGNVEINGCTVNAVGGSNAAGIGGSWGAPGGDVRIVNAIVYARGPAGSGIGGGTPTNTASSGSIYVENSYVTSQNGSGDNDTLQNGMVISVDDISFVNSIINGANFDNKEAYHSHDGASYEPWASTDSLPKNGSYVLVNDVVLTAPYDPATTNAATRICLNGYGVRNASSTYMIEAFEGSNLTIDDCGTNVINKITLNNYRGVAAERVAAKGTDTINSSGTGDVYINGGYITGGSYAWGSAIRVTSPVTINGGTFIGNTSDTAGAIRVNAGGTLTMNGGQIIYNRSSASVDDGGAINEETGGKILFSGNPVVKNNVDANGNARNVNIRWNMTTKPQVIAELKDGAEIGVTCSGVFTSSENTGYNDASKFTCDKTYYIGITKNSSGQLELVPDPAHYEVSGNTVTIKDAIGWETLCDMLEGNTKGYYTNKTVVMGDSFTITRMAGNDSHPFTGTFDGNEKTLTANITTGSGNCAPFSHTENATFRNIKVDGTLTTSSKFAAAIAAHTYGTTNITNCLSSVTINTSINGDGTHGGFVGVNENGTLTFTGCVFGGSMLGSDTKYNGGFVGWGNGTIDYNDCLFAPASMTVGNLQSGTFHRNNISGSFNNTYYTQAYNDGSNFKDQGKQAYSVTSAPDVSIDFGTPDTVYSVSGITAYTTGIEYGGTFYAGNGEMVEITLSFVGTLDEGYHPVYNVTLTDGNLTIPGSDVLVNALPEINTYTVTWKNGNEDIEIDTDVPYNTAPSFDGAEPTKTTDAQYVYTFSGWTDSSNTFYAKGTALPAVTGDETYTATFATSASPIAETIALIDAIGTVEYTPESKAKIDAARDAYDALTDAQKELVTNYSTLTDAEAAYAAEYAKDWQSVTIDDQISINFILNTANHPGLQSLTINYVNQDKKVTNTVYVDVNEIGEPVGGFYRVPAEVAPAQIGDTITVTIVDANGTATLSTSIKDYCEYLIANYDGENAAAVRKLAKATLEYGQAANDYFAGTGYYTAAQITTIEDAQAAIADAAGLENHMVINANGNIRSISYMAVTKPEFRFYVNPDNGLAEADYVALNDKIKVIDVATNTEIPASDDGITVQFVKNPDTGAILLEVTGIEAATMDEVITIEIDGFGTITFCGNDFARLLAKNDNDAYMQTLGAALYLYGKAAADCFPA